MIPWIAIGCAVLATAIGGMIALRYDRHMHLFNAFTAGLLLGAAFFEILPEAVELQGTFTTISAIVLLGFLAFYVLQRFTIIHSCHDHCDEEKPKTASHIGLVGAIGLAVHRFLDGTAIGIAFAVDYRIGLAIAIAVVAHGFGDGISTISVLHKHHNSHKRMYTMLSISALAPVLGAVLGASITVAPALLGMMLAFFAGFFIYLSTNDLLPEAHDTRHRYSTVFATLLGAGIMYALALLA